MIGKGTAFLVGKQWILTAAHNVCNKNDGPKIETETLREYEPNQQKWSSVYIVFDVQKKYPEHQLQAFPQQNIYRIEKVIDYRRKKILDKIKDCWFVVEDWALMQLDREVKDRVPLRINFSSQMACDDSVYMLGHPMGLPLKFTSNGIVQDVSHSKYFDVNIDAFRGNSGSPIFDYKTKMVVGLLYQGNNDYIEETCEKTKKKRTTVLQISQETISKWGFEKCQKLGSIKELENLLSPTAVPLEYPTFEIAMIAAAVALIAFMYFRTVRNLQS